MRVVRTGAGASVPLFRTDAGRMAPMAGAGAWAYRLALIGLALLIAAIVAAPAFA